MKAAAESGIILDRIYTGKAMFGLTEEIQKNPTRFAGKKILFIHTGGIYGFLDGSMDTDLSQSQSIIKDFFD